MSIFWQVLLALVAFFVVLPAPAFSGTKASKHNFIPKQVTDAKTVAIIARIGEIGAGGYTPDPRRAKQQIAEAIEKWGRYSIVDDPSKADLVLLVTEGHTGSMLVGSSSGTDTYRSGVIQEVSILGDVLAVYPGGSIPDEKTVEPLWLQIERGGYSWPAKRAIGKFRKDVEAADRSNASAAPPSQKK